MANREDWATWECPVCHEMSSDPDSILETCCPNGHVVLLGEVLGNGRREVWSEGLEVPFDAR